MKRLILLALFASGFAFGQVTTNPIVSGSSLSAAITTGTIDGTIIGGTSPAAISGTTITATGLITARKGATFGITIGDVSTNNGSTLNLQGTSVANNWSISNNIVAAGLNFTPSTAGGGTTYTTPTMSLTPGAVAITGTLAMSGVSVFPSLPATTTSIGGGALAAGACASGTVAVTNSTTSMTVSVSPNTYPGDGIYWLAYVSVNGTVTVKVCAAVALTPTASTYNVRVIQ